MKAMQTQILRTPTQRPAKKVKTNSGLPTPDSLPHASKSVSRIDSRRSPTSSPTPVRLRVTDSCLVEDPELVISDQENHGQDFSQETLAELIRREEYCSVLSISLLLRQIHL